MGFSPIYLQSAQVAAAIRGYQARFDHLVAVRPEPMMGLAMECPSTGSEEQYSWMGDVPTLKLWDDDRRLSQLRAWAQTIKNHDFAGGVVALKNDILDGRDKINVMPRIESTAVKARRFPALTLGRILLNGFSGYSGSVRQWSDGKSFDGKYFFATDHTIGAATYSNTGTAALSHDNFDAAMVILSSYQDEFGEESLDITGTHLIVGPSKKRLALEIAKGKTRAVDSVQADNVYAGEVEVIESRALVGSYANYWFLADLSWPIKPLIYQPREPATFTPNEGDLAFMRNILRFGAQRRDGYGYGEFRFIYGSTGAG